MTAFRGSGLFTRDGWPARADVEACWAAVADGRLTRAAAHDWAVPWIEGDAAGHADGAPTVTGLTHLHGVDRRSLDEIRADLEHWRVGCVEYDADPETDRLRKIAVAMAGVRAERRRQRAAESPDDAVDDGDGAVDLPITDVQRAILRRALLQWGGPATCSEELARAMGFRSVADLGAATRRLLAALRDGRPLPPADWVRLLLSAEIVVMSDVVGAGRDWAIVTGLSDAETLVALRGLQRQISRRWSQPPRGP